MKRDGAYLFHTSKRHPNHQLAFTIVELLVVIVVIGVLAAITIVSYTGITQRANISSLTSDLTNASTQLKLDIINNGSYPDTLNLANNGKGITASAGTTYFYSVNNNDTPQSFCITAIKNSTSYQIRDNNKPIPGNCLDSYGITAWYKMDGNINDSSGNNNNGVFSGTPQVVSGKIDQAYELTNSQYMLTGITNISQDLSVSLWMLHNGSIWDSECLFGTRTGNNGFMFYRNSGDTAGYYRIYFWYINTSNAVVGYNTWPGVGGFAADTWYNVVMTRASDGQLRFYRNGSLVYDSPPPADFKAWHNNGAQFAFHAQGNGTSYTNGDITMDDMRIYNRSLSSDEVTELYTYAGQ